MAIIASGKGNTPPVPAGVTRGVCYGVVDMGTQPAKGTFPARRKVAILFELPEERGDFMDKKLGKTRSMPRAITYRSTLSLSTKSNLFRDLCAWRGRQFTKEELAGFDLKKLLGVNGQLNIAHDETGKYANIKGIMPLAKGMVPTKPENPTLCFDLDAYLEARRSGQIGENEWPEALPEWLQTCIKQSEEYIALSDDNRSSPEHPETGGDNHSQAVDDEPLPF